MDPRSGSNHEPPHDGHAFVAVPDGVRVEFRFVEEQQPVAGRRSGDRANDPTLLRAHGTPSAAGRNLMRRIGHADPSSLPARLGRSACLGEHRLAPVCLRQAIAKPARILVGFPPGGGADIVARQLAERLRGSYAPAVVVENRPGAGGRLAVEAAKNGDRDGSVILVSPNPMITLYPHIYRKLAYDPVRDLAPVTSICSFPLVLVAGPGFSGGEDRADLVRWAKNPRQASYATCHRRRNASSA
jgi:hypothetical protein